MSGFSEWESDLTSIIEKTNQNLRLLRRIGEKRTDLSSSYDVSTTRPGGLKSFSSGYSPRVLAAQNRYAAEDPGPVVHPRLSRSATIDTSMMSTDASSNPVRSSMAADPTFRGDEYPDDGTAEVRSAAPVGVHGRSRKKPTGEVSATSGNARSISPTAAVVAKRTEAAERANSRQIEQLRSTIQVEISAISGSLEKKVSDLRTDLNVLSAENAVVTEQLHQVQDLVSSRTHQVPDALLKLSQVDETVAKLDKQATLLVGWKATMDKEVCEASTKLKALALLPDRAGQIEKELSQVVQALTTTTPRMEEAINAVRDRVASAELLLQKMPDQKALEHAMQHRFATEMNELELRMGQKIEFLAQKMFMSEKTIYTSRVEQMTSMKQEMLDEMQSLQSKVAKKADAGALQNVQNSLAEELRHLQTSDERNEKKLHELRQQIAELRDEIMTSRAEIVKTVSTQQARTTDAIEDKMARVAEQSKDRYIQIEDKLQDMDKRCTRTQESMQQLHQSLQRVRVQQQTLKKLEQDKSAEEAKQDKLKAQCVKAFAELEKMRVAKTKAQKSLEKMRLQREKTIESLEKRLVELQTKSNERGAQAADKLQQLHLSQALVVQEKQTLQVAWANQKRWNETLKSRMTSLREQLATEREKARLDQQELLRKLEQSQLAMQLKLREAEELATRMKRKEEDLRQMSHLSQRELSILQTTKEAKETQTKLLQLKLEAAEKVQELQQNQLQQQQFQLNEQQQQFDDRQIKSQEQLNHWVAKERDMELLVFENKQQISHLEECISQLERDKEEARTSYEQLVQDKIQSTSQHYEQRLQQVMDEMALKDQEMQRLLESTVSKLAFVALEEELSRNEDAKQQLLQQMQSAASAMEANHSKEKEEVTFFYTSELAAVKSELKTQLEELHATQQALRASNENLQALRQEFAQQQQQHESKLRETKDDLQQILMEKRQLEREVERLIEAKTSVEMQLKASQATHEETAMQKTTFERLLRECEQELEERTMQLQELQARELEAAMQMAQVVNEKHRLQQELERELEDLKLVMQRQKESHEMNELATEENLQLLKLELVRAKQKEGEMSTELHRITDALLQSEMRENQALQNKVELCTQLEALSEALAQSHNREAALQQQAKDLTAQVESFVERLRQSEHRGDGLQEREHELTLQVKQLAEELVQSEGRESDLQQRENDLMEELHALNEEVKHGGAREEALQQRARELSAQVIALTDGLAQSEGQVGQVKQTAADLLVQLSSLSEELKQRESREHIVQVHENELTAQVQMLTKALIQSEDRSVHLQQSESALTSQLLSLQESLELSEEREAMMKQRETELRIQFTTVAEDWQRTESYLHQNESELSTQLNAMSQTLKLTETREGQLHDTILQFLEALNQVGLAGEGFGKENANIQERLNHAKSRVQTTCDDLVALHEELRKLQEEKQMLLAQLATYRIDLEQARYLLQDLQQANLQLTNQLQLQDEQMAARQKANDELITELQTMKSSKLQLDQELVRLSRELETLTCHAAEQKQKHEEEMETLRGSESRLLHAMEQIRQTMASIEHERQTKLRQTQLRIEKLQACMDQLQFEAEVDQRVGSTEHNDAGSIAKMAERHAQIEHEIEKVKAQLKGDVTSAQMMRLQASLAKEKAEMNQLTKVAEAQGRHEQDPELEWEEEVLRNAQFMSSFLVLHETKQHEFYQHFAQQAPLLVQQVKQIESQWKAWNDEAMNSMQHESQLVHQRSTPSQGGHNDEAPNDDVNNEDGDEEDLEECEEHLSPDPDDADATNDRVNWITENMWRQIEDEEAGNEQSDLVELEEELGEDAYEIDDAIKTVGDQDLQDCEASSMTDRGGARALELQSFRTIQEDFRVHDDLTDALQEVAASRLQIDETCAQAREEAEKYQQERDLESQRLSSQTKSTATWEQNLETSMIAPDATESAQHHESRRIVGLQEEKDCETSVDPAYEKAGHVLDHGEPIAMMERTTEAIDYDDEVDIPVLAETVTSPPNAEAAVPNQVESQDPIIIQCAASHDTDGCDEMTRRENEAMDEDRLDLSEEVRQHAEDDEEKAVMSDDEQDLPVLAEELLETTEVHILAETTDSPLHAEEVPSLGHAQVVDTQQPSSDDENSLHGSEEDGDSEDEVVAILSAAALDIQVLAKDSSHQVNAHVSLVMSASHLNAEYKDPEADDEEQCRQLDSDGHASDDDAIAVMTTDENANSVVVEERLKTVDLPILAETVTTPPNATVEVPEEQFHAQTQWRASHDRDKNGEVALSENQLLQVDDENSSAGSEEAFEEDEGDTTIMTDDVPAMAERDSTTTDIHHDAAELQQERYDCSGAVLSEQVVHQIEMTRPSSHGEERSPYQPFQKHEEELEQSDESFEAVEVGLNALEVSCDEQIKDADPSTNASAVEASEMTGDARDPLDHGVGLGHDHYDEPHNQLVEVGAESHHESLNEHLADEQEATMGLAHSLHLHAEAGDDEKEELILVEETCELEDMVDETEHKVVFALHESASVQRAGTEVALDDDEIHRLEAKELEEDAEEGSFIPVGILQEANLSSDGFDHETEDSGGINQSDLIRELVHEQAEPQTVRVDHNDLRESGDGAVIAFDHDEDEASEALKDVTATDGGAVPQDNLEALMKQYCQRVQPVKPHEEAVQELIGEEDAAEEEEEAEAEEEMEESGVSIQRSKDEFDRSDDFNMGIEVTFDELEIPAFTQDARLNNSDDSSLARDLTLQLEPSSSDDHHRRHMAEEEITTSVDDLHERQEAGLEETEERVERVEASEIFDHLTDDHGEDIVAEDMADNSSYDQDPVQLGGSDLHCSLSEDMSRLECLSDSGSLADDLVTLSDPQRDRYHPLATSAVTTAPTVGEAERDNEDQEAHQRGAAEEESDDEVERLAPWANAHESSAHPSTNEESLALDQIKHEHEAPAHSPETLLQDTIGNFADEDSGEATAAKNTTQPSQAPMSRKQFSWVPRPVYKEGEESPAASWKGLSQEQVQDQEFVEEEIEEVLEEEVDDGGEEDGSHELQLSDSFEVSHESDSFHEDSASGSSNHAVSPKFESSEGVGHLTVIHEAVASGGATHSAAHHAFPSLGLDLSSLQDSSTGEDSMEFPTQLDDQLASSQLSTQLTIAEQEMQEMDIFEQLLLDAIDGKNLDKYERSDGNSSGAATPDGRHTPGSQPSSGSSTPRLSHPKYLNAPFGSPPGSPRRPISTLVSPIAGASTGVSLESAADSTLRTVEASAEDDGNYSDSFDLEEL